MNGFIKGFRPTQRNILLELYSVAVLAYGQGGHWAAAHTNIFGIYLLMVNPVSSTSTERSFSTMWHIKLKLT